MGHGLSGSERVVTFSLADGGGLAIRALLANVSVRDVRVVVGLDAGLLEKGLLVALLCEGLLEKGLLVNTPDGVGDLIPKREEPMSGMIVEAFAG